MKEHPDYKYRPRRKPKPLLKKEPKFGFSSMMSPSGLENSRSVMPPMSVSVASGMPSLLGSDSDPLKLSRSLFPPLPYLYPFRHPDESKFAAELALLYGNGPLYPPAIGWPLVSGACNICPPAFPRRSPSPDAAKRPPVCVIVKNEEFRGAEPVPAHVI